MSRWSCSMMRASSTSNWPSAATTARSATPSSGSFGGAVRIASRSARSKSPCRARTTSSFDSSSGRRCGARRPPPRRSRPRSCQRTPARRRAAGRLRQPSTCLFSLLLSPPRPVATSAAPPALRPQPTYLLQISQTILHRMCNCSTETYRTNGSRVCLAKVDIRTILVGFPQPFRSIQSNQPPRARLPEDYVQDASGWRSW